MIKKIDLTIFIFTIGLLLTSVFNFSTAFAKTQQLAVSSLNDILNEAGIGAQYNVSVQGTETAIPNIIGQIVAVVLGFVGSMFLILTIYSGLQWMTAGGNEEKVKAARTRMINSIMGMAITIAAYFITYLISATLLGTP